MQQVLHSSFFHLLIIVLVVLDVLLVLFELLLDLGAFSKYLISWESIITYLFQ